jgi:hypothetical protein
MRKLFAVLLLVAGLVVATSTAPAQAGGKPGLPTGTTYVVTSAYAMTGNAHIIAPKGTDCVYVNVWIGDGGPAVAKVGRGTAATEQYVAWWTAGCVTTSDHSWYFAAGTLTTGTSTAALTYGEADVYVTVQTVNEAGRTIGLYTSGPWTYSPTL